MKKLGIFVLSLLIIFGFFSIAQAVTLTPLTKQMGIGSKGPSVVTLQNFLVNNGYLTGIVDGKFGPKTKLGVIKYQKANKISPTGFVGPLTFASINKIISGTISSNSNTSTTGASSGISTGSSTGTSSTTGTTTTNTNTTQALSISTSSTLPNAQVGVEYQTDIEAMGGTAGYNNWEIISGALPPGILLTVTAIRCIKAPCYNWMPARISGTPTQEGSYNFTMKVMSGDEQVQKNFTLQINSSTSNSLIVCEYAQPPVGYHYENIHTHPPCGATLVAN